MTKISELHRRWSKDDDYKDAYAALGEEFDLARTLINARTAAGLSQSQLARRMKTSQSYIARIEGGESAAVDGCFGALRARDAHAAADCVRTTANAVIHRGGEAGHRPTALPAGWAYTGTSGTSAPP